MVHAYNPSYSGAEAENCLNPGGRGCFELRSHHCTPAWATRVKLHLKKKEKKKKKYIYIYIHTHTHTHTYIYTHKYVAENLPLDADMNIKIADFASATNSPLSTRWLSSFQLSLLLPWNSSWSKVWRTHHRFQESVSIHWSMDPCLWWTELQGAVGWSTEWNVSHSLLLVHGRWKPA